MARTVLVVDDAPEIRALVQLSLEQAGWQVAVAADGDEAAAAASATPPDAVLLDLYLAAEHGPDVAARLAALPGLAAVPVVYLTADEATQAAPPPGAAGVVPKPFPLDALPRMLEELLGWR